MFEFIYRAIVVGIIFFLFKVKFKIIFGRNRHFDKDEMVPLIMIIMLIFVLNRLTQRKKRLNRKLQKSSKKGRQPVMVKWRRRVRKKPCKMAKQKKTK